MALRQPRRCGRCVRARQGCIAPGVRSQHSHVARTRLPPYFRVGSCKRRGHRPSGFCRHPGQILATRPAVPARRPRASQHTPTNTGFNGYGHARVACLHPLATEARTPGAGRIATPVLAPVGGLAGLRAAKTRTLSEQGRGITHVLPDRLHELRHESPCLPHRDHAVCLSQPPALRLDEPASSCNQTDLAPIPGVSVVSACSTRSGQAAQPHPDGGRRC
jgi:hypothetical protein